MKKTKLTLEESLEQIQLTMNYDSSKTCTENKEIISEQLESPGSIAKKTAIGTAGATGLGAAGGALFGGSVGAGAGAGAAAGTAASAELAAAAAGMGVSMDAAGTIGAALTAGGGTAGAAAGASIGAIGMGAIAGAAALALIPLVLWLADKDKAYPKTKKLFEYVKANKEKIDQVPRGLDDDTIQQLSDDAYNAMKGLGTNNKLLFSVFTRLQTVSDLSALISTFNEDHMNEGDGDLLEWLDSDIDISSTWNQIYVPVRNLVKKFAKQMAAEGKNQQGTTTAPIVPGAGAGASGGFKPCEGTYKLGCSSETIGQVQKCLGGLTVDNKFGPKTQARLGEVISQFSNGFTNADVMTICKAANATSTGGQPAPINTSNLKPPTVGATNMAQGFSNAPVSNVVKPTVATNIQPNLAPATPPPSISNKQRRLMNRRDRLNNKLGMA